MPTRATSSATPKKLPKESVIFAPLARGTRRRIHVFRRRTARATRATRADRADNIEKFQLAIKDMIHQSLSWNSDTHHEHVWDYARMLVNLWLSSDIEDAFEDARLAIPEPGPQRNAKKTGGGALVGGNIFRRLSRLFHRQVAYNVVRITHLHLVFFKLSIALNLRTSFDAVTSKLRVDEPDRSQFLSRMLAASNSNARNSNANDTVLEAFDARLANCIQQDYARTNIRKLYMEIGNLLPANYETKYIPEKTWWIYFIRNGKERKFVERMH